MDIFFVNVLPPTQCQVSRFFAAMANDDIPIEHILAGGSKIREELAKGDRAALLKGATVGYILGRFRGVPVILGLGAGVMLDSYVRLPNIWQNLKAQWEKIAK